MMSGPRSGVFTFKVLDARQIRDTDIHLVMSAQTDLVEVLGRLDPKLVKMCPAGDRAED